MRQYTTILFDADNTLFDFQRAEREALSDAVRYMGVIPTEEMVEAYSRINEALWKAMERSEIDKNALREERFVRFCDRFHLHVNVSQMATAYTDFLSKKGYLISGMSEVCERLSRYCRLYIITNGISSVQRGRFEPSPIRAFFENLFISEELGFDKPKKEYFDAVAAAIPHFDPRKTLIVGDSLTSDIQGGIHAGIDTCWFNPFGKPVPQEMKITYVVQKPEELLPLVLGV